jgi:hypothetical protein
MNTLKRLMCWAFGHIHHPWINPELSVFFHCSRCGELAPGARFRLRSRR